MHPLISRRIVLDGRRLFVPGCRAHASDLLLMGDLLVDVLKEVLEGLLLVPEFNLIVGQVLLADEAANRLLQEQIGLRPGLSGDRSLVPRHLVVALAPNSILLDAYRVQLADAGRLLIQ